MGKKSTRKQSAAACLASPRQPPSSTNAKRSPKLSPPESPAFEFSFDLSQFKDIAASLKKEGGKTGGSGASTSKLTGLGSSPQRQSISTISDLKDLASSTMDSVKRQLERSHSEILKDIEASHCRLQKRFKIQTQTCQQLMDEAEKEYKKMSERIGEGREAMKASYAEFMAEAQATASRFYKTSVPEISQKIEKDIATLRSRYGISTDAS